MSTGKACLLCLLLTYSIAQMTEDPERLLNWCLDSKNHKERPGPEGELFSQCTPWKNRSCCTYNTTKNLHEPRMYGFNYDHCSAVKNMSDSCRRHFLQDLCFYECSPNIGPWVVKVGVVLLFSGRTWWRIALPSAAMKVNMHIRKERYFQVPLCESDCEMWYHACQHDYTCTDNWVRNFIWEKRRGNKCLPGTECRTFKQVYKTSTNFCQKVWDDAWKVVNDSEACMRLWFDGSAGNPNDNVAKYKVESLKVTSGTSAISPFSLMLNLFLLFVAKRSSSL